jgi:deoxyribonuclease-4
MTNPSHSPSAAHSRKIGAHVSASGGVDKAVERAHEIDANCVQVFSGSPRVWKKPDLASIDAKKIAAKQQELFVSPIFTHALYLLNLASEKEDLQQKSIAAIAFDLAFDARIGGAGVVVHLGSHQGRGWEAVRDQVATLVSQILRAAPAESHFLMENAAGQNGKIGGDLEEIRWLLDQVNSPQLGWCFDTCHGFASGYSLGEKQHAAPADAKNHRVHSALEEISRLKLQQTLRCIHVNDSRDAFASGLDRHANIGEGQIPPADLKYFLNHDLTKNIPIITEVPGIDGKSGPDAENIRRLQGIAT